MDKLDGFDFENLLTKFSINLIDFLHSTEKSLLKSIIITCAYSNNKQQNKKHSHYKLRIFHFSYSSLSHTLLITFDKKEIKNNDNHGDAYSR